MGKFEARREAPVSQDPVAAQVKAAAGTKAKSLLFTTKTCPNCKMAKTFLDKAGVEYEVIIAPEAPELCAQYGVKQAPTLVNVGENGFEAICNVSNIRKYLEEQN